MSTILLAGATGLVGRHCLERLAVDPVFERIVVVTRRPFVDRTHPHAAKIEEHVVDFDRLSSYGDAFGADSVICALGTTIRKAGSREQFRRVDHGYPLELAKVSRQHGAGQFLLVSALSADPNSHFFYSRVKGELEHDLRAASFESLVILRPSFLAGDRDEFRLGEEIALRLGFALPARYQPVQADAVAAVLVDEAARRRAGIHIIESPEIRAFAR